MPQVIEGSKTWVCGGDGFCFSSAFVQGVDDTLGAGPMVRGPYWRSGWGGFQVPHVEAGCGKEAAQLLLVPKVTRPAQSYLTGTSSPVRPPGFKRQA